MRRIVPLLIVALLAGCGGTQQAVPRRPHLPQALAQSWRAQSDAVAAALAANDGCLAQQRAVALQTSVIDAVNARTLPPRFQEPLVSAVNDLTARISCVPPPPEKRGHDHGHGHGHGKRKK